MPSYLCYCNWNWLHFDSVFSFLHTKHFLHYKVDFRGWQFVRRTCPTFSEAMIFPFICGKANDLFMDFLQYLVFSWHSWYVIEISHSKGWYNLEISRWFSFSRRVSRKCFCYAAFVHEYKMNLSRVKYCLYVWWIEAEEVESGSYRFN